MFRKPIKVKSNNQIKGSERKAIKEQFLKSFTNLTETNFEDLLPKKQILHVIKILTANDELVQVYTIDKRPIAFNIRNQLFPTVYLLWKYPFLLQSFTIHTNVFTFINSGADLMVPGIITPPKETGLRKYGNLPINGLAYVNYNINKAAVAVGITLQSSNDMELSNGKGKCLSIYHYYGDKLCNLDGMSCLPLIDLGPPDWLKLGSYDKDFPDLLGTTSNNTNSNINNNNNNNLRDNSNDNNKESVENILDNKIDEVLPSISAIKNEIEEMDDLLNYCFLTAIKYSKTLNLPILTSNFYKLQMIPVCPQNQNLDIKKSSYKKLKPFLDNMCKIGLITIQETKKGVESLISINKNHPKFDEFYISPENRPKLESASSSEPTSNIIESYIINANVLSIFPKITQYKKGDTIQLIEIRKIVTEYVKQNNCQDENNKKLVKMDNILSRLCKTENSITWEELFERISNSMKPCYKITNTNHVQEIINKGKISPITITVAQRTGNKKVTLIDNLELFGIPINEFSKECQHGVAASTSISRPTNNNNNNKSEQLLVQGNQVLFVYNLLVDKYKVPKKYIKGLENAPKKKK